MTRLFMATRKFTGLNNPTYQFFATKARRLSEPFCFARFCFSDSLAAKITTLLDCLTTPLIPIAVVRTVGATTNYGNRTNY